ncbi:CPBP family intramembrane glutamic endopeptidase [Ruicaihuangia caeni]|uniref:CPBP family intramembrane metalloprotease n=1 Tax=Ruicaihuangia caeni TaxID=3042517 RepID=A0AAW6T7Y0_9MICO|nr:CPBP family intramembrane glutamic endopeptidase [Klugiella sp. YN-L-19]MDI2099644.1 CPBP family intramembrane metalloprotease [Klugiella sp. YN-L-19]
MKERSRHGIRAFAADTTASSRRRIWAELLIVLGLSLGASAVYAVVSIAYRLTLPTPLSGQTATINRSLSDREVFDLIYQVLGIVFDLVPVALVVLLLWSSTRPRLGRLGIDPRHPMRDSISGAGLALAIGVPGLFVYLGGKALGLTTTVVPTALDQHWWTVPVLVLAAVKAGVVEEVIAIGYLFARLRDLGWGSWAIVFTSATLRATYHVYQGFGAFIGNFAMGLLFGWLYQRTGRLLPFVIAHVLLDAAIFIGYPWAAATFPDLFGLPS